MESNEFQNSNCQMRLKDQSHDFHQILGNENNSTKIFVKSIGEFAILKRFEAFKMFVDLIKLTKVAMIHVQLAEIESCKIVNVCRQFVIVI